MQISKINRRLFLKIAGFSFFAGPLCSYSGLLYANDAFDYAIKAQNFIQTKEYKKAIKMAEKAVSIDPASDWAFGLLGRAHQQLGQKAKAVVAYMEAVRLNPDDIYSMTMTKMLTQKPLKGINRKLKHLNHLEKAAIQEEAAIQEKTLASKKNYIEKGLQYQVKRVVIDAGHGGFDPGAVGKNGLKEKDITLDIALQLHNKLKQNSTIKSFLTRTGDYYVPLSERTVTANQFRADLFISIHINANKKKNPNGTETYFCSEKASSFEAKKVAELENSVVKYDKQYKKQPGFINIEAILFKFEQKLYWSESCKFAEAFQKRFKSKLPFESRGVHSANFYVLRMAKMPSILLELGFISNLGDEAMLKQADVRKKIASSIAMGLV